MTPRQAWALAHPVTNPTDLPPGQQRTHGAGWIILSILAIDR